MSNLEPYRDLIAQKAIANKHERLRFAPLYIPADRVMAEVAEAHSLTIGDLVGPSRYQHIVAARWEAMRLIWRQGRLSSAHIGRIFNRDHTTVLYALGRAKVGRKRRAA